jgi:hypothetical protein
MIEADPQNLAIQPSFEAYETAMDRLNKIGPQRQGFTHGEFVDALHSSDVINTTVELRGEQLVLPQLSTVERYSWLNSSWYAKHFPEETENGSLMHFTDLPDVTPGPEVRERITEIAQQNGVLVFDYPSADTEHPQRVTALLEGLGIQGTSELLATQTYFTGRVKLKRDHPTREEPLGVIESFDEMIADGSYDPARIENGASVRTIISPEEALYMSRFYDEAFTEVNETTPCLQGLTTEEFVHMATEEDQVVKVVNADDGKIAAVMLLDSDLSELSWVNPGYFKEQFPAETESGQLIWFPGLAADPASKQGMNTQAMINLVAELAERGDNEPILAFDCCDRNTAFLPIFVERMINNTPQVSIDIQPIAEHHYMAIKLST